jgi:hypothetical protein
MVAQHDRHKKEKAHNNIPKSKVTIRAKAVFLQKTNHIVFSALALSLCFRVGLPRRGGSSSGTTASAFIFSPFHSNT